MLVLRERHQNPRRRKLKSGKGQIRGEIACKKERKEGEWSPALVGRTPVCLLESQSTHRHGQENEKLGFPPAPTEDLQLARLSEKKKGKRYEGGVAIIKATQGGHANIISRKKKDDKRIMQKKRRDASLGGAGSYPETHTSGIIGEMGERDGAAGADRIFAVTRASASPPSNVGGGGADKRGGPRTNGARPS